MAKLLADGTKQLSLTKSQFEDINEALRGMYRKTKAGAILLADESGLLVGKQGRMDSNNFPVIAALAAANHAATREIAKILGGEQAAEFKNNFYEGEEENLYVTGVGEEFFLVVVFSHNVTFGMIRVQTEKAIEDIVEIITREETQEESGGSQDEKTLDEDEFCEELSSRLDSILVSS